MVADSPSPVKRQAGGARAKTMGAPLKNERYTALHPGGSQPLDLLPQIRLAAGGEGAAARLTVSAAPEGAAAPTSMRAAS